jgi:UDP-N-acetylglucosamine 1-carboxyvinyltransferase
MAEILRIKGGRPLSGTVRVRGAKNAATKMLIASLLTKEPCSIDNLPFSADLDITRELCETVGSLISLNGDHRLFIETPDVRTTLVPELTRRNRIPILALGPLLHRRGVAEVPVAGGCPIGHRPINFHLEALNKMGIRVERRESSYFAEVPSEIHGAEIVFPYASVGATESVVLTAARAKGRTVIENAAVEPEIINMLEMLRSMGALIECDSPNRRIAVEGVEKLGGARVKVMPDRVEIVSFASAALSTGGDIFIPDISEDYLHSFLKKVKEAGGSWIAERGGIRFWGSPPYRPVNVETAPHPGFMTDWQQPFAVVLAQAEGESVIHETVFEDRFGYVKDLNRMGASIAVSDECPEGRVCRFVGHTFNHIARIRGARPLRGSDMAMTDVRAGMAHVIAALAAEGESVITGVEHLDRGYERIDERLSALGADIERV